MQATIMKFGGTSVEGATAIQNAARIVFERRELRPVVIVSAMSGFTDALLESVKVALHAGPAEALTHLEKHFERHDRVIDALLANEAGRMRELVVHCRTGLGELLQLGASEVADEKQRRKCFDDAVVSYGQRMSAAMLASVLLENKVFAEAGHPRRCVITEDQHGCATPLMDKTVGGAHRELTPRLQASCIPVMGGFILSLVSGHTTTLSCGGSDSTAAIVLSAL